MAGISETNRQTLLNVVDIIQHRLKLAAIHTIKCQPFYGDYLSICGSGMKIRRPEKYQRTTKWLG